jgi:tRNA-splicing ligase RtcB
MAPSIIKTAGKDIHLWAKADEVEDEAFKQLRNVAALPWVFHHVAVMPDVHAGKGCTVGSVIAMKDAVAPAAVGVDIGCGMGAVRTTFSAKDLPDNLETLRSNIEATIPVGFNGHESPAFQGSDHALLVQYGKLFDRFHDLDESVQYRLGRAKAQVGTLGGGNHFVEVCLDTDDRVWLMLHSGSRNIGKELAEIHIERAKKLIHNENIPDPEMAVFLAGTPEMEAYRHDLFWAQDYALLNRSVMFDLLTEAVRTTLGKFDWDPPILCHHNYVSEETHFGEEVFVTRKGAINAREGQMGIIPGSMGTKSYIVRGLGNPDSFCSASHGAGRRMSRGKAKRSFTVADLEAQTAGVCCRKDADVIDEIPAAYKDIDQVMKQQEDLVEIVAELKQVLCVKG